MNPNQLATLKLDATITFDDLVNVFVSRHEDALHLHRGEIQRSLKLVNADRAILVDEIKAFLKQEVENRFGDVNPDAGIKIAFELVSVTEEHDLKKTDFWPVTLKQSLKIDRTDIKYVKESYGDNKYKFDLAIKVTAEHLKAWHSIAKRQNELKEQLVLVNADIQSIDRKTRQVKGLLAAKKLEQADAMALLESDEIKNILKITQG